MDSALIAVGGVAVGALASGSVQSYLARADRRRDARSAARLLYMQLHGALKAVNELREARDWTRMITDWKAYEVGWERHNENLARTLDTTSFQVVAASFECLASLARSKEWDMTEAARRPSGPANFDPSDALLAVYIANIEAARNILLKSSFRWWEKRARRRAMGGS